MPKRRRLRTNDGGLTCITVTILTATHPDCSTRASNNSRQGSDAAKATLKLHVDKSVRAHVTVD